MTTDTIPTIEREIKYSRQDRDYACYVNGQYIGSRANYSDGEALCNQVAYDLLMDGQCATATELDGGSEPDAMAADHAVVAPACATCGGEGRCPDCDPITPARHWSHRLPAYGADNCAGCGGPVPCDCDDVVDAPLITGQTVLYGQVIRVGGRKPKVLIASLDHSGTIACDVKQDIARILGGRLYTDIAVSGTATWNSETLKIESFRIEELLSYRKTPLTETFRRLSEQFGNYYDELGDGDDGRTPAAPLLATALLAEADRALSTCPGAFEPCGAAAHPSYAPFCQKCALGH